MLKQCEIKILLKLKQFSLTFIFICLTFDTVFLDLHLHLFNHHYMSPKNSNRECCGCAGTLAFNEGNIHGWTSWVCIHPYSFVKATSVAIHRGWVFTHTLLWRQHPWPYTMGGCSPILCCGGNIRDHTSSVCIHPYSVVNIFIHAYSVGSIRDHMFWVCIYPYFHESNNVFLAAMCVTESVCVCDVCVNIFM